MRNASSQRVPACGATQRVARSTPSRPNTASASACASALEMPVSPPKLYSVIASPRPGQRAAMSAFMRGMSFTGVLIHDSSTYAES